MSLSWDYFENHIVRLSIRLLLKSVGKV